MAYFNGKRRNTMAALGLAGYGIIVLSGCTSPKVAYDVNNDGAKDVVFKDEHGNFVWHEDGKQEFQTVPAELEQTITKLIEAEQIRRARQVPIAH